MDEQSVESVLSSCERELAEGRVPDLRALGFWRVVASVKRDPSLVARHADQIARVDRAAFQRAVTLHVPALLGVLVLASGAIAGVVLLAIAGALDHPLRDIIVLAGAGALDATTHGLSHFIVGSLVGIRFTDWFVDLPKKPQPGLKVDYASYLRTSAASRAWMHASGAIATKLTPFAIIPYALAISTEGWTIALLLALGVIQIVTDVLFSVKASDWKKFRREIRLSRASRTTP